jgi:hypothetical protein
MSTTKTTKVETKVADKAEAKKPEAPKAEPKKETVVKAEVKKAAAPKKEAVKAEAKKPAAKAETKKAPAKKAEPKTAPVKKAAAPKKETAKKTEEVYIEYAGSQISTAEIINKVVEATGKKASSIKTLNVYVQPEFGIAYYTVDGTEGKITY